MFAKDFAAPSPNTVFVVRFAHPNARLRSHFTNTEDVIRNAVPKEFWR